MYWTSIDSQRLFSWFSGFSWFVIWKQSPGCSTDAVEKDGICCIFARPSFDSSANHAPSTCSDNELLRTFPDALENTVKKLVCDRNLLLARLQVQDLFSPCCGHGSWMRRTLKCTVKCGEPICTGTIREMI